MWKVITDLIQGGVGDIEIKNLLSKFLNNLLKPIRERKEFYKMRPEEVKNALINGTLRARKVAQETMLEVKNAMNITGYEAVDNIKKL